MTQTLGHDISPSIIHSDGLSDEFIPITDPVIEQLILELSETDDSQSKLGNARQNMGLYNDAYRTIPGLSAVQREELSSHIQQYTYELISHRNDIETLYELGMPEQFIDDAGIDPETTLADIVILGESWDNTRRDPTIEKAFYLMASRLDERERRRAIKAMELALATGDGFHYTYESLSPRKFGIRAVKSIVHSIEATGSRFLE
jgi:hypothetical protein